LIAGVVRVLLVRVSVVARPTKVSVEVGRVSVPVLLMVEITGLVKVLLVKVCVDVSLAKSVPVPTATHAVPAGQKYNMASSVS
jgi:hypothetical protein